MPRPPVPLPRTRSSLDAVARPPRPPPCGSPTNIRPPRPPPFRWLGLTGLPQPNSPRPEAGSHRRWLQPRPLTSFLLSTTTGCSASPRPAGAGPLRAPTGEDPTKSRSTTRSRSRRRRSWRRQRRRQRQRRLCGSRPKKMAGVSVRSWVLLKRQKKSRKKYKPPLLGNRSFFLPRPAPSHLL